MTLYTALKAGWNLNIGGPGERGSPGLPEYRRFLTLHRLYRTLERVPFMIDRRGRPGAGDWKLNKRNFIITTGAVLALVMLVTFYIAFTAIRSDEGPSVTEEYRQSTLTGGGNPLLELRDDFAEIFEIIVDSLSGK